MSGGRPMRQFNEEDLQVLLTGIGSRLRAFGRDCVIHGDMTPGAKRMLDSIAALYDGVEEE